MKTVKVLSGQNLYDLAYEHYGSTDGVKRLIEDNPELITSTDQKLEPGTELKIIQSPLNKDNVDAALKNNFHVTTGDRYTWGAVKNYLNGDTILCVLATSDNRVWICTDSSGIYSLDEDGNLTGYYSGTGALASNSIRWLVEDKDNQFLYAATSAGVARFNLATDVWTDNFTTSSGLISNSCTWIGLKSTGEFFIGTGAGLSVTDDFAGYTNYTSADPELPSNDIKHGFVSSDDRVFLATYGGAVEFGVETWTVAGGQLPADTVWKIWFDGHRVWIGLVDDGVVVYDGTNFIVHDGNGQNLLNSKIRGLTQDLHGNMLIGTWPDGTNTHVIARNDLEWKVLISSDAGDGLPMSQPLQCLAVDGKDGVWIGTKTAGVYHYERNPLL